MSGKRDMFQLLERFKLAGGVVTATNGKHYKLTHPGAPGAMVIVSGTPSDWRAMQNTKSTIRRELGVAL